jgi:hypothetical protein
MLYHLVSSARHRYFSGDLKARIGAHTPYEDVPLDLERMRRWSPLNQSLYYGYKVHLAGLLLNYKGDRVAMANSVETRYPYLDEDVIAFFEWAVDDEGRRKKGMEDAKRVMDLARQRLSAIRTVSPASVSALDRQLGEGLGRAKYDQGRAGIGGAPDVEAGLGVDGARCRRTVRPGKGSRIVGETRDSFCSQ